MKKENRGGNNKKVVNNPFKDLSDVEVQYWLGLIAADGWVSKGVWLGLKEEEHIEEYVKFLKSDVTIHKADKHHATFRVGFRNEETCKFLDTIGITPKKSLTLNMKIPITRDFFRGVFDGDGYSPKWGQSAKITSGSLDFLNQLKDFLSSENIISKIAIQQKGKNICYALYITASQFEKFYSLLYSDTNLYLKRKEERLRLYVEKRKRKLDKLLEACNGNQQPIINLNG